MIRQIRTHGPWLAFAALAAFSFGPAAAQNAAPAPAAAAGPKALTVELNKLEPQGGGCRAYVVVQNDDETAYQAFKLDLVLFQKDGIIGRRFAMDLAPLKAKKRTVKLFDLDDISCDKIGSFLINDVVDCKSDAGPVENCLAGTTVKSLGDVQLTK
ncbi:MAG: hypothetical protein K2Y42_11440 [Hyphomicrobium sp.]|uniref:hypothetical protein n=1 Tax=Hyphomicrobium sp. TaxID=82 RepID=UPI0025C54C9B|nr:hypothetical protein [Hyphomicrobium sp.]MBX9863354.1 hypothetical protein [Hyphomicrobium sp.]